MTKEKQTKTKADPDVKEAPLVTLAEMAKELKTTPVQLQKMAQQKQVPAVKIEGEWRFNKKLAKDAFMRRSRGF